MLSGTTCVAHPGNGRSLPVWFSGWREPTKCTLLVLYVVWPVLWIAYRLRRPENTVARSAFVSGACQLLLIFFLSLYVINLGYGFENTCQRLGQFRFVSRLFGGQPPDDALVFTDGLSGNRFAGTFLGQLIVPLPANYLRGIDEQRRDLESRWRSYLAGEWRRTGWWYYYLYALAVKVPLGIWALVLSGPGHDLVAAWATCCNVG